MENSLFPGHPVWFTGYPNVVCARTACSASKPAGTASTYCAACDALPTCDECGEPVVDCDAQNRFDDARGRADDYDCLGAYLRLRDADYEGYCDGMESLRMETS